MTHPVTFPNSTAVLKFVALTALIFGLWALQHPYAGIFHDAQLYTIQALARVYPADLANDVFLRLGSQEHFTFFGPLYAAAIRALGVAPAAAVLTFSFHAVFVTALWLFARRVLPAHLVWLGVGLVCVVPLTYGARKVFFVMEDFVTPRLLAEACVLLGLAAVLDRRFKLAALAMLVAGLVHPIMALTGLAAGVFLDVFTRRQRLTLLGFAAGGFIALLLVLSARGTPLQFDEEWWPLIHGGTVYLFPLDWYKLDWARVIVVATALYAGIRRAPAERIPQLCRAVLIALAAGLCFSIIGSDVLHVVLVTQLQTWRVAWLASLVAVLVAPAVLPAMWRGGKLPRVALIALLAAFLMADERFALPSAVLAALLVVIAPHVKQEIPALRMVLFGMYAILALAVVINLGSSVIVSRALIDQTAVPAWLLRARSFTGTGLVPAMVLIGCGLLMSRARPALLAAGSLVSCAFALLLASGAYPQWARSPYSADNQAAFAGWRALIPQGTEVLWYESPMAAWTLLQRPDYASMQQAASALFSRDAAMLLRDRLLKLKSIGANIESSPLPLKEAPGSGPVLSLGTLCNATGARFVVTRAAPESQPLAVASDSLPPELRDWKLFACEGDTPRKP